MDKRGLSEITQGHHPSGKRKRLSRFFQSGRIHFVESLEGLGNRDVGFITGGIEVDSHFLEGFGLFYAVFDNGSCFFHNFLIKVYNPP